MRQLLEAGPFALARGGASAPAFAWPFALAALLLMCSSSVLVGLMPLQLSVATVFLFAGPHNWVEFRYFVSRMPVRWGRSRRFFRVALIGAPLLTIAYAAWPQLARAQGWGEAGWLAAAAGWNTLFVGWVAALVLLRGREKEGRDWSWAVPAGLGFAALAWLYPPWWGLALVYLHPLLALWFLDRQLRKSRPAWLQTYRACLCLLPLLVAATCWLAAGGPDVASGGALAARVAQHAGAEILPAIPDRLLVSAHVYLETIHYGVWLLAIPLVGLRAAPWRLERIPLVSHPRGWPRATALVLACGALLVLALWACFSVDYLTTRDVYFTAAMLHVLAEVPFLLRLL